MRPLEEWTVADLEELVGDDVQESLTLDYKQSAALAKNDASRNELAKDVSAFANSAGGRIVYGIIEENHSPTGIDGGVDPAQITREWIEQVIRSRIQPVVQGVVIKPIRLTNGFFCYVIDIPQAIALAPHQAFDNKYYRRANFLSVPMEDYEVKDALRRSSTGEPIIYFRWERDTKAQRLQATASLKAYIGNRSAEPVLYASVNIMVDNRLLPIGANFADFRIKRSIRLMNTLTGAFAPGEVAVLERNIMPGNHMPVFREQEWLLLEASVDVPQAGDYYFGYRVTCPGFVGEVGGFYRVDGYSIDPRQGASAELFPPATLIREPAK